MDEGDHHQEGGEGGMNNKLEELGEYQMLQLPIANVGRLMKQILPPNAKISKEAKETMQECVSEFISFVTGEASEKCRKERRKTVTGEDICWAMESLGLDNYSAPLRLYLQRYTQFHLHHNTNNNHTTLTAAATQDRQNRSS